MGAIVWLAIFLHHNQEEFIENFYHIIYTSVLLSWILVFFCYNSIMFTHNIIRLSSETSCLRCLRCCCCCLKSKKDSVSSNQSIAENAVNIPNVKKDLWSKEELPFFNRNNKKDTKKMLRRRNSGLHNDIIPSSKKQFSGSGMNDKYVEMRE